LEPVAYCGRKANLLYDPRAFAGLRRILYGAVKIFNMEMNLWLAKPKLFYSQ
jgi:hypothetical protein